MLNQLFREESEIPNTDSKTTGSFEQVTIESDRVPDSVLSSCLHAIVSLIVVRDSKEKRSNRWCLDYLGVCSCEFILFEFEEEKITNRIEKRVNLPPSQGYLDIAQTCLPAWCVGGLYRFVCRYKIAAVAFVRLFIVVIFTFE